ncbi:MAG: hypothetical protein Q8R05_00185, partial [Candidatus Omnitrophota bacterium]|nr:hypothetical protein [Candidatus Omnitrophota bacterium]
REAIRVSEFKVMLKDIRSRQIRRAKEVRTRLDEFRKERQDGLLEWNRLTAVMADKRAEGGEVREKEEVAQGK